MSRSARTFLSKNKQMARMAIGAIAMLAMAGPAFSQKPLGPSGTKCSSSRPSYKYQSPVMARQHVLFVRHQLVRSGAQQVLLG